jgi:hypothetical protein
VDLAAEASTAEDSAVGIMLAVSVAADSMAEKWAVFTVERQAAIVEANQGHSAAERPVDIEAAQRRHVPI